MFVVRRALLVAGVLAAVLSASGCTSVWHNMQPHRLHQLNRGPGMPTGAEAYSSVEATAPPVG
jgi:hypothetical protein